MKGKERKGRCTFKSHVDVGFPIFDIRLSNKLVLLIGIRFSFDLNPIWIISSRSFSESS